MKKWKFWSKNPKGIQKTNGREHKNKSKLSIKNLAFFSGVMTLLAQPVKLVYANEFTNAEKYSLEYTDEQQLNEYDNEQINTDIYSNTITDVENLEPEIAVEVSENVVVNDSDLSVELEDEIPVIEYQEVETPYFEFLDVDNLQDVEILDDTEKLEVDNANIVEGELNTGTTDVNIFNVEKYSLENTDKQQLNEYDNEQINTNIYSSTITDVENLEPEVVVSGDIFVNDSELEDEISVVEYQEVETTNFEFLDVDNSQDVEILDDIEKLDEDNQTATQAQKEIGPGFKSEDNAHIEESKLNIGTTDVNIFNKDLIGTDIVIRGKEDVDRLFVNRRISKKGVLNILEQNPNIPDDLRPSIRKYIENRYQNHPDPDMRMFAFNLNRLQKVTIDPNKSVSYYDAWNNEIFIADFDSMFHELEHVYNLPYGRQFFKEEGSRVQKSIGITVWSFENNNKARGMKEAFTADRNNDSLLDCYGYLHSQEQIIKTLFIDDMYEIVEYNDFGKLEYLFLESGLTEDDYNDYIATTDLISDIYISDCIDLDYSLVSKSYKTIAKLVAYKCYKEQIDVNELFESFLIYYIPATKWQNKIINEFRYSINNFQPSYSLTR